MKKFLAVLLSVLMCLSLAACSAKDPGQQEEPKEPYTILDTSGMDYNEASATIYKYVLGDFAEAYKAAYDAEAEGNVSLKYATEAIAEAKLMEAAVMLPTTTSGGNYAISRVAPYTVDYQLWGSDEYNIGTALICSDFIKASDRDVLKAKWNELRGTGTYHAWAKQYLSDQGYTFIDNYSVGFSGDPRTWDVLSTSRAADAEAIIPTYSGLLEYDCEGVQQFELATDMQYVENEDGTVSYIFTLRDDATWVDSQGRYLADVVADDFVAGFQHMLDAQGGLDYLIDGIIVGAHEYINNEITDFSQVGVEAVDAHTVKYTLTAPCSYFLTMFGYTIWTPLCREYYTSLGGTFGIDEYNEAKSAGKISYGLSPESIAYCGPYLVSNFTSENKIEYTVNPTYFNKDKLEIKTYTWLFNDGTDPTKAYKDAVAGTLAGVGLSAATLEICKADGLFDTYAYTSSTNATSYMGFINVNRASFANVADSTAAVSTQSADEQARTHGAVLNVHFRRALCYSVDRGAYNAQIVGEDLKLVSLRNTYTPGNFCQLTEEVTVEINGVSKTYPAGTYYGKIMQDQIDADGVAIKVWDEATSLSDGYDGWYSPENCQAELAIAVEELAEAGITVDAEHPIQIDLPYPSNNQNYTNKAVAFKQSAEAASNGLIQVNLVDCKSYSEWYDTGYYTDYGYEANYDLYDLSGWGPDYGDPQTYLDTFLDEYAGYMIKCIGIY